MLDLRGSSSDRALTQFLSGRIPSPSAGIDVTHDIQPFLGFGERSEIAHVKTEALAAFLATPTDEKSEPLELGKLCLLECHGRRR